MPIRKQNKADKRTTESRFEEIAENKTARAQARPTSDVETSHLLGALKPCISSRGTN